MDEAHQEKSQKEMTPGARVRFRQRGKPRIVAESYTVMQSDRAAGKVKIRHDRPRDYAHAYVFWYDMDDVEEETDGSQTADSP